MSFKQLVEPNLSTAGRIGYCLDYARRAFGAPAVEPTAWAAWTNTQYKHVDMNLPTDVSVPIWFSYIENGVNFGHVAINVPGKGIYSSPWQQGTTHAVLPSISKLISIYSDNGANPMVYEGWSEDISTIKVVGGSMDNSLQADRDYWYNQAQALAKEVASLKPDRDYWYAQAQKVAAENADLRKQSTGTTKTTVLDYINAHLS